MTYTGLSLETFQENLYEHYGQDYSAGNSPVTFAIVFGVLFSGVTGKKLIFCKKFIFSLRNLIIETN